MSEEKDPEIVVPSPKKEQNDVAISKVSQEGKGWKTWIIAGVVVLVVAAAVIIPATILRSSGDKEAESSDIVVDSDDVEEPYKPYQQNMAEIMALIQSFPDEPFYMVNVFSFRDVAEYEDGRETALSGKEANEIYSHFMSTEMLPSIGAGVVFAGPIQQVTINIGNSPNVTSDWHSVAVVRYPNSTNFQKMLGNPGVNEMAIHKKAALKDTLVFATSLQSGTSFPPPPLDSVEFPSTKEDLPLVMFHINNYRDTAVYRPEDGEQPPRSGREAMELYTQVAGPIAFDQGARPAGFFSVNRTVIGDMSRHFGFEEVRINTFPSRRALGAVSNNETRKSAMLHRLAAIEKAWSFLVTPFQVNTLGGNGMTGHDADE